ncbi:MAG TPA: YciI family protein [Chloroflexota bacterium]|jgi:hypothetical protein|nr:YciI family protein [Chloroflexota bacterium]
MRYACLIYTDEAASPPDDSPEAQQVFAAYDAFEREAREAGVYDVGEALHEVAKATTVRVRNGERLVTDGPFAETKEQLGGFYILNCKDLDEALAWAAKIPAATRGSIEVRPIMEFE